MSSLSELYQNVILEHNRSPRNYRAIEDAHRSAEGNNPLCGDQLTVWLRLDGDTISDAAFQGMGCAISRASASLMTAAVKGKSRQEAGRLFDRFHRLVTAGPGAAIRKPWGSSPCSPEYPNTHPGSNARVCRGTH